MAEWIGGHEWDVWLTGTFQPDKSYKDTINTKRAFGRFINDLQVKYNKDVGYFMAVERFKDGQFTHVHAVLSCTGDLRYKQIGETWRERYGRESVERYEKGRGANYYVTKYISKELCDWDFKFIRSLTIPGLGSEIY